GIEKGGKSKFNTKTAKWKIVSPNTPSEANAPSPQRALDIPLSLPPGQKDPYEEQSILDPHDSLTPCYPVAGPTIPSPFERRGETVVLGNAISPVQF
ncbi:MAG: hypothetical protein ACKO96_26605, partial [Flammeovirgaceae bacterium]